MKNKTIGIYGIFRKSDNKCMYIGQSKDCERRIRHHLNGSSHLPIENKDDYYFDVIEKHGFDSKEFRLSREAFWINMFDPEWNICRNRTSWNKGKTGIYSEEARQKIREAHLGKTPSEETRQKLREAHLNKTLSEETRQKMSKSHLGKPSNTLGKHWKLDPTTNKRIYY